MGWPKIRIDFYGNGKDRHRSNDLHQKLVLIRSFEFHYFCMSIKHYVFHYNLHRTQSEAIYDEKMGLIKMNKL